MAAATLVVEGIYALRSLRDRYTFSVFRRAERADRLRRGVRRDGEELRLTWVEEWMPAEDEHSTGAPGGLYRRRRRQLDTSDGRAIRFRLVRWSR